MPTKALFGNCYEYIRERAVAVRIAPVGVIPQYKERVILELIFQKITCVRVCRARGAMPFQRVLSAGATCPPADETRRFGAKSKTVLKSMTSRQSKPGGIGKSKYFTQSAQAVTASERMHTCAWASRERPGMPRPWQRFQSRIGATRAYVYRHVKLRYGGPSFTILQYAWHSAD